MTSPAKKKTIPTQTPLSYDLTRYSARLSWYTATSTNWNTHIQFITIPDAVMMKNPPSFTLNEETMLTLKTCDQKLEQNELNHLIRSHLLHLTRHVSSSEPLTDKERVWLAKSVANDAESLTALLRLYDEPLS
jgi:hypothetical protein